MAARTVGDLRVVGWEHAAAQARVIALLAQQRAASGRDDLRAVRLLAGPLLDAQRRYQATAEVLASAADHGVLAGVS